MENKINANLAEQVITGTPQVDNVVEADQQMPIIPPLFWDIQNDKPQNPELPPEITAEVKQLMARIFGETEDASANSENAVSTTEELFDTLPEGWVQIQHCEEPGEDTAVTDDPAEDESDPKLKETVHQIMTEIFGESEESLTGNEDPTGNTEVLFDSLPEDWVQIQHCEDDRDCATPFDLENLEQRLDPMLDDLLACLLERKIARLLASAD